MIYIFDSSPLIHLFKSFYLQRFPTLWQNFDNMVENSFIFSVDEVYKEISNKTGINDRLTGWAEENKSFFKKPTESELMFVSEIFKIKQFRELITKEAILSGKPVADPFVIAAAKIYNACVVTFDGFSQDGNVKLNSPKVANICRHFSIECCNLEQFMEKENWIF